MIEYIVLVLFSVVGLLAFAGIVIFHLATEVDRPCCTRCRSVLPDGYHGLCDACADRISRAERNRKIDPAAEVVQDQVLIGRVP